MADSQMRHPNLMVPNAQRTPGSTASNFATPVNYSSVGALRTRLAAVNGTYYTTSKLDQMTVNDMVFALRSIDDRTTIADYMPVSTA